MSRSRPRHGSAYGALAASVRPHAMVAGMVASVAVPSFAIAVMVPRNLVLPTLSLALLAGAAVLALIAWRAGVKRHAEKVTLWDVCGACAFIGFATAILSKPENILTAFAPVGG